MKKHSQAVILTSLVCFISGCTAYDVGNAELRAQNGEAEFVGWVKFNGEFLLYQSKEALERGGNEGCISGALPLALELQAAKKYDGSKVKIVGKLVPWQLPTPLAVSLNNEGAPIKNWCRGSNVVFAREMVRLK